MATRKLIHKYADTLAAMEKDAAQNLEQAQNDFQQMQEARREADAELKGLKDAMKENHRGFWGAAKAIMGMIYKRPETPAEIEQALEPVIAYQVALGAVPTAEETCEAAKEAEQNAQEELFTAEDVWITIKGLKNLDKDPE